MPEVDDSVTLVNAAGSGAANWTPTKAGTYYLTHETQTNGVNGAEVLGAWFEVAGPELTIEPQGELTNGVAVKVEKVGGGGEWTVYYSLDGSEPTAGSTVYEGPFALPASATVKAVAISAGGVSSEVASKELVLSPALAVEDVAARQRYPWNGKVDIDCEVKGDAAKKYAVTFVVEDEIGHTNLPIRTVGADVLGGPQPQNNENALDGGSGVPGGHALPFVLSPGKYRFVWDAAADLPKGTRFGGVSVSIDAVPSPLADWKRVVEITVDGYAGSETLTDVPVLVRLSSAIEGFDYNDFAAPDMGADMIFTDMEGVAFSLRDCYRTLEEMRLDVKRIFLIGGGARSRLWSEIVANVFNCDVAVPTPGDASFGACLLAGTGIGIFADVKAAVAHCLHVDRMIRPAPATAAKYDRLFTCYRRIHDALAPVYRPAK